MKKHVSRNCMPLDPKYDISSLFKQGFLAPVPTKNMKNDPKVKPITNTLCVEVNYCNQFSFYINTTDC